MKKIKSKIYSSERHIDKDEFYNALKNQDIKLIEQISQDLSLGMVCALLHETESVRIIHKGDRTFFNTIVDFLEKKSEQELIDKPEFSEVLFSQNTNKVKTQEQRKEKNITKFNAHYTYTEDIEYVKNRKIEIIKDFKNKYYDLFFDHISLNKRSVQTIMSFDMNFKLQNKFARMCGSSTNSINILTMVFEHPNYKKFSKHHFIRHAANSATNVETLDFLMKADSKSFKKGFQTMLDKNEFWNSLKYGEIRNTDEFVEKVIWFEKHNMGYTNNKMKGLIEFFSKIETDKIKTYTDNVGLEKIQPYLEKTFSRYVKYQNDEKQLEKIEKLLNKKTQEDEKMFSPYNSLPPEVMKRIFHREKIMQYLEEIMLYDSYFYDLKIRKQVNNFDRIKSLINYQNINSMLDSKEAISKSRKI